MIRPPRARHKGELPQGGKRFTPEAISLANWSLPPPKMRVAMLSRIVAKARVATRVVISGFGLLRSGLMMPLCVPAPSPKMIRTAGTTATTRGRRRPDVGREVPYRALGGVLSHQTM